MYSLISHQLYKPLYNVKTKDKSVGDVYGEKYGWRMFCSSFLTQDISNFLICEYNAFAALLASKPKIKTVIEVGCGYGRHMELCVEAGINYQGIDLIDWFIEIGQWRKNNLGKKYQSSNLSSSSVINIEKLVSELSIQEKEQTLIYFPFNCLGNIPYLEEVLSVLNKNQIGFACSIFNNHENTYITRNDYYKKCGLTTRQRVDKPNGTIIESEEGLSSIGFNITHLVNSLGEYGFTLSNNKSFSDLANMLVFNPKKTSKKYNIQKESYPCQEYSPIPLDDIIDKLSNKNAVIYYLSNPCIEKKESSLLTFQTACIQDLEKKIIKNIDNICPIGIVEVSDNNDFKIIPVKW